MGIVMNKQVVDNIAINGKVVDGIAYDGSIIFQRKPPIYGIRREIATPLTSWERIEANKGKVANAVQGENTINTTKNDFDSILPWKGIKSCDLLSDGTINAYIGDTNYDPINPKGYIMTEIPEFWWKREQPGDGHEYIYISPSEQIGYIKSAKRYISRYQCGGSSNELYSKSNIKPLGGKTMSDFRTLARNIGAEWRINRYNNFINHTNVVFSRVCRL